MTAPASSPHSEPSSYEAFFGFARSPFTLAPDPRFLYLSPTHGEANRLLLQAIRRKEGFIVLAGDIGTGKTTLCRTLLAELSGNTFTSLVLDPHLSANELLRELLLDFGIVSSQAVREGRLAGTSTHDLVGTLHEFLLSLVPLDGTAVLIIDEAQHLAPVVLEQIRLLSNLETNEGKLLQIVLVGQLGLLDVLERADLRQLNQRISLRARLEPLARSETDAYVAHRLEVAAPAEPITFEPAALDRVHTLSEGVPRVINLLCDRVLTLAAADRSRVATAPLVNEAATRLGLARSVPLPGAAATPAPRESPAPPPFLPDAPASRPVGRILAAAALAIVLLILLPPWHELVSLTPPPLPPPPPLRTTSAPAPPIPTTEDFAPPPPTVRRPATPPAAPTAPVADLPPLATP